MNFSLPKFRGKWLPAALSIAICALHALLFHLRWHYNLGASPTILMLTFWIAVIALFVPLKSIRTDRWRAIIGSLPGFLLLLPGATTCISWTLWSLLPLLA